MTESDKEKSEHVEASSETDRKKSFDPHTSLEKDSRYIKYKQDDGSEEPDDKLKDVLLYKEDSEEKNTDSEVNDMLDKVNAMSKDAQEEFKKKLVPRISTSWYLLPVFLGLLGGVIGYFSLRDRDRHMAKVMMWVGLAVSAPTLIFWGIIFFIIGLT